MYKKHTSKVAPCCVTELPAAKPYHYRNSGCSPTGDTVDHTDFLETFHEEPKCLVVVINRPSRKALFDEFMQVGRVVANPL